MTVLAIIGGQSTKQLNTDSVVLYCIHQLGKLMTSKQPHSFIHSLKLYKIAEKMLLSNASTIESNIACLMQ